MCHKSLVLVLSAVGCSLMSAGCAERSDNPVSDAATRQIVPDDQPETSPPDVNPDKIESALIVLPDSEGLAEDEVAAAPAKSVEKQNRDPIYDTETPGEELIAAALRRAQRDHKHVLIEWGGNWCGWCYKLHDVFEHDETVHPIVYEEYELVLVDQGNNHDLMLHYGGTDRKYAYPHLTVLDTEGNVLTNQETGSLEIGPKHEPEKVAAFLKEWTPANVDAEQLLTAALKQAEGENKHVLLRVGTPYCGWCKVLAQFIQDHGALFTKDYVDVKIDTLRMENGEAVADRFAPQEPGGIPWFVILDSAGTEVASSQGPDGNVGYPYQPGEIAHFVSMLRDTSKQLTEEDLAVIEADLTAYRTQREATAGE